jgi:hypothetical protein
MPPIDVVKHHNGHLFGVSKLHGFMPVRRIVISVGSVIALLPFRVFGTSACGVGDSPDGRVKSACFARERDDS